MDITRRQGLGLMGIGTMLAVAPSSNALARKEMPKFLTKIDLQSAEWNRDTRARLNGDLNESNQLVGWLEGVIQGVRPNEPVRDLMTYEGVSVVRMHRRSDGSWRKLLRETVVYRDIKTGRIMDTWLNPYTEETVGVVPIANNPYNQTIEINFMGKPWIGNWTRNPDGTLTLFSNVNLFYPNALVPSAWPRESTGDYAQVTENFNWTVSEADLVNPEMTYLPRLGSWQRVTPWLPWMLMGAAPGHINYFGHSALLPGGIDALARLPQDLIAAVRAIDPNMLRAPTLEEDTLPNESSLEAYAKEQKPAPMPAGWSPPQPPAPPKFSGDKSKLGQQFGQ